MLSDRLKSLRLLNNLTQKQVAINLGLSEARYGQYETNKRKPDYGTLKDIAKFYQVSTDYLLGNEVETKNEKIIKEKEALKKALVSIGYMQDGEDLSDEELERLMKFVKQNKEFIKKI